MPMLAPNVLILFLFHCTSIKARLYLAVCLVVIAAEKYRGRVQRSTAISFEMKASACPQVKVAMLELDVGSNILLRRHSSVWR
jgi:hypothetical protein